jgi:hypothetical protein
MLTAYNIFQPYGHDQILYMHLWLISSFPYIGQCLHMGIFCVIYLHISAVPLYSS